MNRRRPTTFLGVFCAAAFLASATTGALAQPPWAGGPPGHARDRDRGPGGEPGGGPPPWAPAWGYRAKQTVSYSYHGRMLETDGHDLIHLPRYGSGACNRDVIGAILGGAVGAAAGSQIGKGDGRDLATVGGAIIGVLIGGSIGRDMDEADQNCVGQVLERAPTGRTVTWQNPDERGEYSVTPTRTYQSDSGEYCREYQTKIVIDGRARDAYGRACRQPDGTWKRS